MDQFLKNFRFELEEQGLSLSTRQTYLRSAERFIAYANGKTITRRLVQEYNHALDEKGFKAATINLNMIAVNKFLRFCDMEQCTVKVVRLQQRQSLNYVLEPEDYHKLLDYALESGREKYYMIMRTLAKTGIRISELRYITVEALDAGVTQVHNKGRYRDVYLPDGLIAELRRFCEKEQITRGSIFKGNKGTPLSRKAVWKMLKKIADMTGIDKRKVHPHAFRHFFCISYMNKYGNIFELADFPGHVNVETTRIYSKSTTEQKRKRLDALDN